MTKSLVYGCLLVTILAAESLPDTAVVTASGANSVQFDSPTCLPADLLNAGSRITRVKPDVELRGHRQAVNSAAFSSDGLQIVTASSDRTARVWRADGIGDPMILSGHTGSVTTAAFSPGGTRVATASLDGSVRLWRLDGGSDPVVFRSHTGSVESVTFSGDGFRLLSAGSDGTARSWRIDGSGTNLVIRTPAALYSAEFSPDLEGSRIITAGADGTAQIWRSDGTGPSAVLKGHDGRVNSAAFNADGTRAITAGTDKTARVWRLDGPIDSLVLRGHEGAVLKASFGSPPEGKSAREIAQRARWPGLPADVITAGEEGTACVWSNDGGLPLVLPHIARRGAGGVNSAAFSPDGTRVVTAGDDGRVLVWQIGSPKARQ